MKNFTNAQAAAAALAIVLLAACGEKTPATGAAPAAKDAKAQKPAGAATSADPSTLRLAGELAALVKLGPLPQMDVAETLRIAGRLEVNGSKTARIGAPVT